MKFIYKARTKTGKLETGTIEAYSKESAALLLQKYDIFVTSIEEQKAVPSLLGISVFNRVSPKELSVFFRQLSVMLESRVPVVQALISLGAQIKKKYFKEIVLKVSSLVEQGMPLSEALASYPALFNTFYVNLVKSGEASGNIASSLGYISQHLEEESDISSQLRQAMVYPLFVVSVLVVVIAIIIVQVMPRIADLIAESGATPSLFSLVMLKTYGWLQHYWLALVLFAVLVGLFCVLYPRTSKGRRHYDSLSLQTPFLGNLLKKIYLTRLCGNLATLMAAGVSINKALNISQQTIDNGVYRQVVAAVEKEVSQGEKLSSAMTKYDAFFPSFVVQMINVGEETGKLDATLADITAFYQKETKVAIALFSSLIEPVVIIFLGGIVALLAISVLAPLYGALGNI